MKILYETIELSKHSHQRQFTRGCERRQTAARCHDRCPKRTKTFGLITKRQTEISGSQPLCTDVSGFREV